MTRIAVSTEFRANRVRFTSAALGNSREERGAAYRSLLADVLSDDDLQAIRTYLQQQRALGRDDFRERVEARTG